MSKALDWLFYLFYGASSRFIIWVADMANRSGDSKAIARANQAKRKIENAKKEYEVNR